MKYLLVLILAGGGCYFYMNKINFGSLNAEEGLQNLIEKNGYVSAERILDNSHDVVMFTCKDDEILKTWKSSRKECLERISNFQGMCQERIFPDLKKQISSLKVASKLYLRYVDCLLPQGG